jgi:hypothetical protein
VREFVCGRRAISKLSREKKVKGICKKTSINKTTHQPQSARWWPTLRTLPAGPPGPLDLICLWSAESVINRPTGVMWCLKSIPVDGAHLLVEVSPRLSRTDLVCGPRRFFQPGCCRQVPHKGRGGPVEPATVVKVEAPLNGRVCGWVYLGSYDPACF